MQSFLDYYELFGINWLTAILIGSICGYVGTFVVLRRLSFLADTIGHSAIAGVGLGVLLGIMPTMAVIPFSILIAIVLTYLARNKHQDLVGASAAIFSVSVGIGIIILSIAGKGSMHEVMNVLFGDLLLLGLNHLMILLILGIPVTALIAYFRRELILMFMNEELAQTGNINTERLDYLFMVSVAIIIGISINLVGVILVMGLLTIPALVSGRLARSLKAQLSISPLIGALSSVLGVAAAFAFDLPPGACIVLVCGIFYLIIIIYPRSI